MAEVIDSAGFQRKVIEADKPVLLDFFATWCGPCKRLAPVLDEVASELEGKAYVYKIDIDQSPDVAAKYKISSVPTVMAFNGGEIKAKLIGAQPKQDLLRLLD